MSPLVLTHQTGDSAPSRRGQRPTNAEEWVLVHVWSGDVLARFDDEVRARAAISSVDDDDVVVLHVNA